MEEAAGVLNVSEATVRRLIKEKILPASQHCKGAPWVIRADDLDDATVKQTADGSSPTAAAVCGSAAKYPSFIE